MADGDFLSLASDFFGGGGAGLLGGLLGGGTKVEQNVSQSTSAALLASINNTIGSGSTIAAPQTATSTQNPNALSTGQAATSPSPVYGQTFGPDYTAGDLAATADTGVSLAGFQPLAVIAMLALAGAFVWKEMK